MNELFMTGAQMAWNDMLREEQTKMNLIQTLKDLGGYWKYEGGRYLAKLDNGKISDTFVDTGVLTCRPSTLSLATTELIRKLNEVIGGEQHDFYVCGPAMGGVTLAYEIAQQLRATAIYTEPVYGPDEKTLRGLAELGPDEPINDVVRLLAKQQDFTGVGRAKTGQQLKRFTIPEGATILFVTDEITTGKSVREMIEAVHQSTQNINVLPYVLCLVNRSGSERIVFETWHSGVGQWKIISLADVQVRTWDTLIEAQMDLCSECKCHDIHREVTGTDGKVTLLPDLEAVCPRDIDL